MPEALKILVFGATGPTGRQAVVSALGRRQTFKSESLIQRSLEAIAGAASWWSPRSASGRRGATRR